MNNHLIPRQKSLKMRRDELVCLKFDSSGNCFIKRFRRTDILREANESLKNDCRNLLNLCRVVSNKKDLRNQFYGILGYRDKRTLLKFFGATLQSRDIRQVDPSFSSKPALWVRFNAILVSLEQIRSLILYDRIFLFDPDHPKVQRAVKIISERLDYSETRDSDSNGAPYEFRALEGIFINVCMSLEKDLSSLEPTILENLDDLPTRLTSRQLEELRSFKQRLGQFSSRSSDVQRVLQELLENDENMISLYLTEKNYFPEQTKNYIDHEEVEIMAESYLQVVDQLTNRAELLDNAIDDTEDLVMIRLDTIRNRILFVELTINLIALTFGAGSLIAGIFGMNFGIPVFKEENQSSIYFMVTVGLVCLLVVSVYSWLFKWCREKGLYST